MKISFGQQVASEAAALSKTGDSILITQLKDVILNLQRSTKKFKDLVIASHADDNLYLSCDGKKFEISYRADGEDGQIYLAKLQDFAVHNGYDVKITESAGTHTAGKPLLLPTLSFIEKNAENAFELTRAIMLNVFRNKKNTYYQLIMPE